MTEKHPLTDETCGEILDFKDFSKYRLHFVKDAMCAAADWQLERVLEQWEEVIDSNKTDIQIIREFDKRLKAMRPQQREE